MRHSRHRAGASTNALYKEEQEQQRTVAKERQLPVVTRCTIKTTVQQHTAAITPCNCTLLCHTVSTTRDIGQLSGGNEATDGIDYTSRSITAINFHCDANNCLHRALDLLGTH